MQRLNKKPGMTLLEVICAISIMSILCLGIITFQLNNLSLSSYSKEKIRCTTVLEAIKEEILNNASYNDMLALINQNKIYVDTEGVTLNNIRYLTLEQVFSESCTFNNSYISLSITNGEILTVELNLHLKFKNKEEMIKCIFYKGNYL